MSLNPSKSKIIHSRFKSKKRSEFLFKCGETGLEYCNRYKYLGLWLDEHLDFNFAVNQISNSASRALGLLISKNYQSVEMKYEVFDKLYSALILRILTYGSCIWGYSQYNILNKVQMRAAKANLGLPKNASNLATIGDIGWKSLHSKHVGEIEFLPLFLGNTNF